MAATAAAQSILDAQKNTWNAFAPGWNKWDEFFMHAIAPMGEALLAAVELKPGQRVLDVATGTGEPGLTAAERVRSGEVIGIDISEAMVKLARENAAHRRLASYRAEVQEASALPYPDGDGPGGPGFDAIVCRLGIMFFADMPATLAELRRVLKPAGRIAFSSWAEPPANPWASLTGGIVSPLLGMAPPPEDAPGFYRFSNPEKLKATLSAAGFTASEIREVNGELHFESAAKYWEFMTDVVAPIAKALQDTTPEKRSEAREAVLAEAGKLMSDRGLILPWKSWVGVATR